MQTEQQAFSHESHRYSITTATTLEISLQSFNTGELFKKPRKIKKSRLQNLSQREREYAEL